MFGVRVLYYFDKGNAFDTQKKKNNENKIK